VRAQNSILGLEAMTFGLRHVGLSVTLGSPGADGKPTVVIYDPPGPAPAGALFPWSENFVWAALQTVGAKTAGDPGHAVWGDRLLTYKPGADNVASLSAVRPGDVLQFQDVGTPSGHIVMHTAIVVANLGGGRLLVVQQNFNGRAWVSSDPTQDVHDFNTYRGGTVWVYRPVAK
jgi:hypothetical protein